MVGNIGRKVGDKGSDYESKLRFEPSASVSRFMVPLCWLSFLAQFLSWFWFLSPHSSFCSFMLTLIFCSKSLSLLPPLWAPCFCCSLDGILQLYRASYLCTSSNSRLARPAVLTSFASVIFPWPGATWWMRFPSKRSPHVPAMGCCQGRQGWRLPFAFPSFSLFRPGRMNPGVHGSFYLDHCGISSASAEAVRVHIRIPQCGILGVRHTRTRHRKNMFSNSVQSFRIGKYFNCQPHSGILSNYGTHHTRRKTLGWWLIIVIGPASRWFCKD